MSEASTNRAPNSALRFVAAWVGTLLVVGGILFPLFTLQFLTWSVGRIDWIHRNYDLKAQALAARPPSAGPRLLIFGGSASVFGLDAEMMEDKLGIHAVNFATGAGLGLDYQISRVKRHAKRGDIALLCLELEAYGDESTLDEYMREYAFSFEKSYILRLNPRVMFSLLYLNKVGDYAEAFDRWNQQLEGASERDVSAIRTEYSVIRLGPNGDFRGLEPDKPFTYGPPAVNLSAYARHSLIGLFAWCRRNGVRPIVTWPNRIDAPPPDGSSQFVIQAKVTEFCKEQGVDVVGVPEECVFPRELFIDTAYHINEIGQRIRTDRLIQRLRTLFKIPPPNGPKTIYVMASRYDVKNERGIFGKDENMSYRYLSESAERHPDWITPRELPELATSGARVVCLDDATEKLAEKGGVHFREVKRQEATLADWVRKYDRHFFFMSLVGATQSPVAADHLPENFSRFLSGDGYRAALIGTGPWTKIHRNSRGPEKAEVWRRRFDPLPIRTPFHFRSVVKSGPAESFGKGNPPILVEGETLSGLEPGLAVAVIDPELGILKAAGTFGKTPLVEWKLRQMETP